uniref:Uncharacterized protein n=1 Tax=Setaria italica TaxID=4555 RepID=K3XUL1_SETIT
MVCPSADVWMPFPLRKAVQQVRRACNRLEHGTKH